MEGRLIATATHIIPRGRLIQYNAVRRLFPPLGTALNNVAASLRCVDIPLRQRALMADDVECRVITRACVVTESRGASRLWR